MTTALSVRLPDELSQQLELLAAASKRTKSFCAIEAVRDYVKNEFWQLQAIEEDLLLHPGMGRPGRKPGTRNFLIRHLSSEFKSISS